MNLRCPQCGEWVQELARYCARCGQSLGGRDEVSLIPSAREASLLPAPSGFLPCDVSTYLYFKWESPWGGPKLLATESQVVLLFNAGETMREASLEISARDDKGKTLAIIRPSVVPLPRGEITRVEVPSYELPDDVHTLTVALERSQLAGQER